MDLEIALQAVSENLDEHSKAIAETAGAVEAVAELGESTREELRALARLVGTKVLPVLERLDRRLDKLDELEGRQLRVEAEVERRLRLVPTEAGVAVEGGE